MTALLRNVDRFMARHEFLPLWPIGMDERKHRLCDRCAGRRSPERMRELASKIAEMNQRGEIEDGMAAELLKSIYATCAEEYVRHAVGLTYRRILKRLPRALSGNRHG